MHATAQSALYIALRGKNAAAVTPTFVLI